MNNYSAYLKTEHWKEFRELALEKLGRICADCGTTEVEFDVHHLTYKTLWHEKLSDVIVLCKSCHMERHLEKIIMRKFKTDCLTVEEILHVGLKRHEKKWGKVKLGDSFAVITKSGDVIIARVNSDADKEINVLTELYHPVFIDAPLGFAIKDDEDIY